MLPDVLKGSILKAFLKQTLDGNKGSTLLGTVAAAILASDTDFSHLMHGIHSDADAQMWGKIVAILFVTVWGYFVGKKPTIDK